MAKTDLKEARGREKGIQTQVRECVKQPERAEATNGKARHTSIRNLLIMTFHMTDPFTKESLKNDLF